MAQIREDLAAEREASVRTAVEQERARWEARLEQELKQARLRSEAERQVSFWPREGRNQIKHAQ